MPLILNLSSLDHRLGIVSVQHQQARHVTRDKSHHFRRTVGRRPCVGTRRLVSSTQITSWRHSSNVQSCAHGNGHCVDDRSRGQQGSCTVHTVQPRVTGDHAMHSPALRLPATSTGHHCSARVACSWTRETVQPIAVLFVRGLLLPLELRPRYK